MEKIYYNNCNGGSAYKEIDNNIYCLGEHEYNTSIIDGAVYFKESNLMSRCIGCPKLLDNNIRKIYGHKTGD